MGWSDETAACKAKGGYIESVCISNGTQCVTRYPDAGKSCANSSECLGGCIQAGVRSANGDVKGECKTDNRGCGGGCGVVNGKADWCDAQD
jgi:hypothetical protein